MGSYCYSSWIIINLWCLQILSLISVTIFQDFIFPSYTHVEVTKNEPTHIWPPTWMDSGARSGAVRSDPALKVGIFQWQNPYGRNMALGVHSVSNRNEYREYFLGDKGGRCVRLTALTPSSADCLEIWGFQPSGTLRTCNMPVQELLE